MFDMRLMKLGFLFLALGTTACTDRTGGDAILEITVEGDGIAIDSLDVLLSLPDGTPSQHTFDARGHKFPEKLSAGVPPDAGRINVDITGLDTLGNKIAHGAASAAIEATELNRVTVVLTRLPPIADGGAPDGGRDGGNPDGGDGPID